MSRRTLILLSLIWLSFIVRGTFYSVLIPIWEGFDEYSHFDFLEYLSNGNGLPDPEHHVSAEISQSLKLAPAPFTLSYLSLTTHDEFWQLPPEERSRRSEAINDIPEYLQQQSGKELMLESKQPPLYYWTATAALRVFRHYNLIDRVFLARMFSVLLASSIVFLSFLAARLFFGDEQIAVQVAALITALPELFISVARVSNEPLAIILFSLLTCLLILAARGYTLAILGAEISLGLGLLTKAYFVAAIPAVAVAIFLALWRANRNERNRLLAKFAATGLASVALVAWWYWRSLGSGSGPIWEDAAPLTGGTGMSVIQSLLAMQWYRAIDFTLYSHVWLGGWSFLSLRSWIYHAFMGGILAGLVGLVLFFLRNFRNRKARVEEALLLSLLYAGFWASLMFHAFVSFTKVNHPASGGHYLYAAIIAEVLIVLLGLWQFTPVRWRSGVLMAVTCAVVLLDFYSSHFVALPYYTGIIRHNSAGSLPAFHISDGVALGASEWIGRILINRPQMLTPALLLLIWGAFIVLSAALPFITGLRRKTR